MSMWSPLEVFNPAPSARGDLQENANPGKNQFENFSQSEKFEIFSPFFFLFSPEFIFPLSFLPFALLLTISSFFLFPNRSLKTCTCRFRYLTAFFVVLSPLLPSYELQRGISPHTRNEITFDLVSFQCKRIG